MKKQIPHELDLIAKTVLAYQREGAAEELRRIIAADEVCEEDKFALAARAAELDPGTKEGR